MKTKKFICRSMIRPTISLWALIIMFGLGNANAQSDSTSRSSSNFKTPDSIPPDMLAFHRQMAEDMRNSGGSRSGGADKAHYNVLAVGPFDNSPQYFYVDTKIPFIPESVPQIHINGYNYAHPNKAISLTLGWYHWAGTWYWAQYRCDLGYYNPSRIRLGTYNDAGTTMVRIEIANDGIYWTSYFFSATDINPWCLSSYENWTYHEGAMPSGTGNITTVGEYGYVNIGSPTSPTTLTVAGTILAREVKVEANAGADFVFAPNYRLRPLSEVEQFITANKHLPDIAPADSMMQNGVNMGEMQIKLLQKIEELMLYTIEQQKQIDVLRQEIETLKGIKNED